MTHHLPTGLVLALLVAQPGDRPRDALESIESTRGGRHWVDERTDPPKSAAESLKGFRVEPGLKVELVAAEPLVMDPVAVAFDERGRMFVAEYGDYPTGPPGEDDPPLSRVVLLEDTDGDGRMDRRHVFADRLTFAHSLMTFRGGLLVCARTQVLFLKDTTGDDTADVREVLFDGFVPAHPQMQIGNPRWGLDNRIYFNYGPGEVRHGDVTITVPRNEFFFDPRTTEFGPAAGLGQYGNTIDNFGRRFFCSNRNPIIAAPIPRERLRRNPYLIGVKEQYDVGPAGGDTRVYPLVEMRSNYLSHAGTHTAACGVTAYLGDRLGPAYENSVFVCEPIGHLVTRSIVRERGPVWTAERARDKADFLASTDTWFRPSNLETGPDGVLYVADMYRLWVEHPKFLPEEIAARLDWRAGDDRGRVWRVVPEAGPDPTPFAPPETTADLVALLSDGNGWRRHLGQRLLVERQAADAVPALRALLRDGDRFARLHALGTLDGLGTLADDDLAAALADAEPHVRSTAADLVGNALAERPALLERLLVLAGDDRPHVRFRAALTLGDSADARATAALARLARADGADPWFATAVLTGAAERAGELLVGLLDGEPVGPDHAHLIRELATVAGARGDLGELSLLLARVGRAEGGGVWWRTAALGGLAAGLPRHQGALRPASLSKLLADPPPELADHAGPVRDFLDRAEAIALDGSLDARERAAAVELLAHRRYEGSAAAYARLLRASEPVAVQLACVEAMQRAADDRAADLVLDRWPSLGPAVRSASLALLLRRPASTERMLRAMADGRVSPGVLDIDRRVSLLRHRDDGIRSLAESVLGGAVSADRRAVAEQYRAALTMKGSAVEGAKVFRQVCAKCHRIDGTGHEVGPDLSDTRNRSREALLYDILDPNQKLEPQFTDYVVTTLDGRLFNGLMIDETAEAVVLGQPEGKRQTVPRDEIDEIESTGKSLMPEGVEKEVSVAQMADLLEYLKGRE